MSVDKNQKQAPATQPDANLAADTRPVPSQAEGDTETIEEDLKNKDQKQTSKSKPAAGH